MVSSGSSAVKGRSSSDARCETLVSVFLHHHPLGPCLLLGLRLRLFLELLFCDVIHTPQDTTRRSRPPPSEPSRRRRRIRSVPRRQRRSHTPRPWLTFPLDAQLLLFTGASSSSSPATSSTSTAIMRGTETHSQQHQRRAQLLDLVGDDDVFGRPGSPASWDSILVYHRSV